MEDTKQVPSDYVDTVRTHLNKIAKIAPQLDMWLEGGADDADVDVIAARAIISAAYHLRGALYQVEHTAQKMVVASERMQINRELRFFGPEDA